MQKSGSTMNCKCGKLIKINKEELFFVCNECSSYYNKKKQLLVSRHNWNVNEFFHNYDKNQK